MFKLLPSSPHPALSASTELAEVRRYIDDESVDLAYLDPAPVSAVEPPFNSNADYNVLFADKDGSQAHAQITAFEDTWKWGL